MRGNIKWSPNHPTRTTYGPNRIENVFSDQNMENIKIVKKKSGKLHDFLDFGVSLRSDNDIYI